MIGTSGTSYGTFLGSALGSPFVRSGQRAGRGQYLQVVTVTGGVAVTQGHTLGRIPTMLVLLDAGNNAYPGFTWPIASRTKTQISITFPVAGTYLIWLS
jgi:hypothetical protein